MNQTYTSSWWFQPIWKILVKYDSPNRGKHKNIWNHFLDFLKLTNRPKNNRSSPQKSNVFFSEKNRNHQSSGERDLLRFFFSGCQGPSTHIHPTAWVLQTSFFHKLRRMSCARSKFSSFVCLPEKQTAEVHGGNKKTKTGRKCNTSLHEPQTRTMNIYPIKSVLPYLPALCWFFAGKNIYQSHGSSGFKPHIRSSDWHWPINQPLGTWRSLPGGYNSTDRQREPQGQAFINGCFNWMMNQIFI